MDIEWVREYCLSLPHTTERLQWEDNLVLKVGGRMYAILALEPGEYWLSFKCSDEAFSEILEVPGVVPAPYLARAKWVSLETENALRQEEIKQWLREAYELIFARLPKRTQSALRQARQKASNQRKRRLRKRQ
jgi:predicted DNA-binding protein (MmcQ/YjbR family)